MLCRFSFVNVSYILNLLLQIWGLQLLLFEDFLEYGRDWIILMLRLGTIKRLMGSGQRKRQKWSVELTSLSITQPSGSRSQKLRVTTHAQQMVTLGRVVPLRRGVSQVYWVTKDLDWFGLVLWLFKHCRLNTKSFLYI